MKDQTQHIRYFLFSQSLSDGIRITLLILLPALVCTYLGRLELGLLISTGALCVSISDAPGPLEHRKNGMLYCNGFVFLTAVLTGLANHYIILMGLLILLAAFFFTMFAVYGIRASSVGIAALLIMVLRMDKEQRVMDLLLDSLFILAGGIWYMLLALLFYHFQPFRQAQRSLGNCIHETSKLLLIKAALYDVSTDVNEQFKKLLAQQVVVNEKQDETRELMFKSKEIVKDSTPTGRALLITFTDTLDLYEQVIATWYDHSLLREKFSSTGILAEISLMIKEIAWELDRAGLAIQSNIPYKKEFELIPALNDLKIKIDAEKIGDNSNLVLKKILINLRNVGERAEGIANHFSTGKDLKKKHLSKGEYAKFVTHKEISWEIFRNNLSLDSSVFRHALRMMITLVLGFVIVEMISYGHHSYWILLTIVLILKPGYSISKERNIQRIAGTIAGGILGIILIATIKDRTILFAFMVFFMIGTYTFQRLNYVVMVILMTPYILILFTYLGLGFLNIVEERVLDTAIASVLAFFASYFLFPHWESTQLEGYMIEVLKANINYLQQLKNYFSGNSGPVVEYKLVRKELYVSTANLSAAFVRMLSEPKHKQQNAALINEFVVLNNVLSSNIASMLAIKSPNEQQLTTKDILQPLNRAVSMLEESLHQLDKTYEIGLNENCKMALPDIGKQPDRQLQEHMGFIYKLSFDIKKVVQKISV